MLYLKGCRYRNDFDEALTAPVRRVGFGVLSPATIRRLKSVWQPTYEAFL